MQESQELQSLLHEAELHGQSVILLFLGNQAVVGGHKPSPIMSSIQCCTDLAKATLQCVAETVVEGAERHPNRLQDIRGVGDCHSDGAAKAQRPSEAAVARHGRYLLLVIDGTWCQAKEMYKVAARPTLLPRYDSS